MVALQLRWGRGGVGRVGGNNVNATEQSSVAKLLRDIGVVNWNRGGENGDSGRAWVEADHFDTERRGGLLGPGVIRRNGCQGVGAGRSVCPIEHVGRTGCRAEQLVPGIELYAADKAVLVDGLGCQRDGVSQEKRHVVGRADEYHYRGVIALARRRNGIKEEGMSCGIAQADLAGANDLSGIGTGE